MFLLSLFVLQEGRSRRSPRGDVPTHIGAALYTPRKAGSTMRPCTYVHVVFLGMWPLSGALDPLVACG